MNQITFGRRPLGATRCVQLSWAMLRQALRPFASAAVILMIERLGLSVKRQLIDLRVLQLSDGLRSVESTFDNVSRGGLVTPELRGQEILIVQR